MNKKSISLIEVLFALIISAILFISISNLSLDINNNNSNDNDKNILKIELESTRLFLQKKLTIDKKLEKLEYLNNTVYYDNNILVKNVDSYSKLILNDNIILSICLKNKIKICQDIRFDDGI